MKPSSLSTLVSTLIAKTPMRSVKPGIMACRSPRFSVVKYSTVHPLFSAKVRKMLAHFLVLDRGHSKKHHMVVKQVVRNIWMKHWYYIIICWKQMIYGELRTVQFIASFWKDKIYEEINVETTTYNWSAFELLLINVEATTYPHQNICLEGAPSLDSNCSHPSAHQCFV